MCGVGGDIAAHCLLLVLAGLVIGRAFSKQPQLPACRWPQRGELQLPMVVNYASCQ